mmetsp:Transcript_23381/g.73323  ORF Transcript_23381/g.73323 Transcript_23381/m.73323 type:complete len:297 (+) Transcript_23381:322-1212(+)
MTRWMSVALMLISSALSSSWNCRSRSSRSTCACAISRFTLSYSSRRMMPSFLAASSSAASWSRMESAWISLLGFNAGGRSGCSSYTMGRIPTASSDLSPSTRPAASRSSSIARTFTRPSSARRMRSSSALRATSSSMAASSASYSLRRSAAWAWSSWMRRSSSASSALRAASFSFIIAWMLSSTDKASDSGCGCGPSSGSHELRLRSSLVDSRSNGPNEEGTALLSLRPATGRGGSFCGKNTVSSASPKGFSDAGKSFASAPNSTVAPCVSTRGTGFASSTRVSLSSVCSPGPAVS